MQHRHLDGTSGRWTVPIVDSTLERGGASDVVALLRAIRRDPVGAAAEAALKASERSRVYGYPALIRAALERWRRERSRRLT